VWCTQELLGQTLRPWVAKKMTEYLGEPDGRMVDHVVAQVVQRTAPAALAASLAAVLDREAEGFVVKLWRMVVFESERARIFADES
jgi:RNA-binding protein 25